MIDSFKRIATIAAIAFAIGASALAGIVNYDNPVVITVAIGGGIVAILFALFHFLVDRRFKFSGAMIVVLPLLFGTVGYFYRTAEAVIEDRKISDIPWSQTNSYLEWERSYRLLPLEIGGLISLAMIPFYLIHLKTKKPTIDHLLIGNESKPIPFAGEQRKQIMKCVCGATLSILAKHSGKKTTCPKCQRSLKIPDSDDSTTPNSDFSDIDKLL